MIFRSSIIAFVVLSTSTFGAELTMLGELNCTACHAATQQQRAWLSPKVAPTLQDVGSRTDPEWLKKFLASPNAAKQGATMPDLLHGNVEQAEALTHYLLSLSKPNVRRVLPDKAAVARGENLFHSVGCVACHAPQNGAALPAEFVALPRMAEKWGHDGLRKFLLDPLASRPGGRMPSLHLTDREASDIAHYLLRETKEPTAFVVDAAKAEQGRGLYAAMNCAVCHEQKPLSEAAPMLAALDPWRGCLAEKPSGKAVDYHLNPPQRAALRDALTQLNTPTLSAPSPKQRVAHTMATFRCTACHVRDGGGGVSPERDAFFTANVDDLGDEGRIPPNLDGVGDKLRPEWLAKVVGEGVSVRPYVNTRMPKFGETNVGHLAELFVSLDRHATPLASVPDKPEAQREEGRRLVGAIGLSCIACHRFNRQPAHTMQVFDLRSVTERLNEDWFRRFLRDPNKFNVGTRMPSLWPGGRSLIATVLGGDTDRQHAALWTYLAGGAKAKFPEGLNRQNMELIVGGEAVVYRGKLWEAGFRAIATGYPGQLNAAFDAEQMRLALVWRGRFLNVSPHWSVQGMGKIRPLENDAVVLPQGSPFAVLANNATPWPGESSRDLGMKFIGYQLDSLRRPTLLYRFGEMRVEDFVSPAGTGLHRTMKFSAVPTEGLHLRLAVGKLSAVGNGAWRLNDALTIKAPGAFVRGEELLVPLNTMQLEVEYVW